MGTLAFDLRDAFRSFRRDRGYASIVIVTLALTIGATTAVFSIVDGVLLKPLAYADPDRLVALREIWQEFVSRVPTVEVNERHFEYWQQHASSFDALAQYVVRPANLTGVGDATQIAIVRCSGALFDVLQVQASIGRTLASSDDPADAPDVVVITDGLWRQRFGARSDVVGTAMVIDGTPRTIVGVIPPDFRLPSGRQLTAAFDAFVEQSGDGDARMQAEVAAESGVRIGKRAR